MPEPPLLDLLIELQTLDRVPRMGYALRGVVDPESVSEHTFHLAFLVWTLGTNEPSVDLLRALELALVHDLVEVRTGDLPRPAASFFPPGAKEQAEAAIGAELLAPLGARARNLLAEYHSKQSPEARFVSACDKLQVRIKALAYARRGARSLDAFWADLPALADGCGFASIERIARALLEQRPED